MVALFSILSIVVKIHSYLHIFTSVSEVAQPFDLSRFSMRLRGVLDNFTITFAFIFSKC